MQKPCTHSQEKSSVSSIRQSVESRHGTVVSVPVFVFLSAPSPHVPDIEIGQSVVSHSPHSLPSPQRSYSPVVIYPKNAVSPVDSFPSGRFPHWSVPRWSVSVGVSRSVSVGQCRSVSVGVGQFPQWSVSNSFPSGQFPQWTVSPLVSVGQWSVSPVVSVGQWSVSSVVSFPQRSLLLVRFPRGPFPQWSVSATA